MCGITGVLNLRSDLPVDPKALRRANDALRHRGPDDEGMFAEPNFGMAVRRLSIIDLPGGHQPMSNEDGTLHIAYNGETYNYKELRAELESLGHRFRTRSDTEVVLHGYEQWGGEGLLEKLRGMYAFAVWNRSDRSLFLARDRMGVKPLYVAEHEGRLYFSSEIRGILSHAPIPRKANSIALPMYMRVGFVTAPYTLFEGIRKLPPAHYLYAEHGRITVKEYWRLAYGAAPPRPEAELIEEFLDRLRESVRLHLVSDVPTGALLSGGIDSTANAALMRESTGEPFKTVTVGFEPEDFDEVDHAAASARALGTDHHSFLFSQEAMDDFPRVMAHQEEPSARTTFAALYYLFQACREQGLKVVLTGEGADELLGGYHWHRRGYLPGFALRLPGTLRGLLERDPVSRFLWEGRRQAGRLLRGKPLDMKTHYQDLIHIGRRSAGNGLLSPEVREALRRIDPDPVLGFWENWMPAVRKEPYLIQILWLQSRTRMVDYINHHVDRMSMAHSVEARPPFLDHKLWEFCARLPLHLMIRGLPPDQTEKYILREACRGVVPEPARVRKKNPLRVPFEAWLARERLPEWAENALSEKQLMNMGLFDPGEVLRLRRAYLAGASNEATLLMAILVAQLWADMFL
jgi:asparagine synthase (glutamine-hydrolysing)